MVPEAKDAAIAATVHRGGGRDGGGRGDRGPRREGGDRGPRREGGDRDRGPRGEGRGDRGPRREGGGEGPAPEFAPAFLTNKDDD